jgi:L-ascorbate metabolism protein UlaG (beta-lactamase superfamily)
LLVDFPHQQPPSTLPAAMTPDQAVQAAAILRAKALLPIYFGIGQPPVYVEDNEPPIQVRAAADKATQRVFDLHPGQTLEVFAA